MFRRSYFRHYRHPLLRDLCIGPGRLMFKHDHHTNQETLCPGGSPPRPNLSTTSMTIFRTSLPCLRPPAGPWRSVRHQKHGSDPSPDAFYLEPLVEECINRGGRLYGWVGCRGRGSGAGAGRGAGDEPAFLAPPRSFAKAHCAFFAEHFAKASALETSAEEAGWHGHCRAAKSIIGLERL